MSNSKKDPNAERSNMEAGVSMPKVGEAYSYKDLTRTVMDIRFEAMPDGEGKTWIIFNPDHGTPRRMDAEHWVYWTEHNGPRLSESEAREANNERRAKLAARNAAAQEAEKEDDGVPIFDIPSKEDLTVTIAKLESRNSNLRAALDIAKETLRDELGDDDDA